MDAPVSTAPVAKASWDPLRLSHIKPSLTNQEVTLAARQDLWHKFIIFDAGNHAKESVLNAVMAACEPEVLLPIMYRVEHPQKGTFLARCSISVIENLVKQGLRITTAEGHSLNIDIVLGFLSMHELPINPQRVIYQALYGRYEPTKKVLNLENFHRDKALGTVYCPLSSHRVFLLILRCCKMRILGNVVHRDSRLPIRELNLKLNGMTCVMPFDKLFNYHLTKLDLRFNKIQDINHLRYFSEFKITELWLDGNPLCSTYTTTEDYVRSVKNVFPHLHRLDGVMIGVEQKMIPMTLSNYLSDGSNLALVKQFIRHFFTFYDQDDRIVLNGLYDHDALFSTTLGPITNSTHQQMTKVFATNRNLLKFVDYAKCHEFLLRGPEKIIAALRRQPATFHDYKKFNIDILNSGNEHLIIAIQGSFCYKEFPYAPLFFNRTFVIIEGDDNEYCIANDQYHIQSEVATGKSIDLQKGGFIATKKIEPTVFSGSEKEQLLRFLQERTTMNREFCQKFLEDAKWDIRSAISCFMKAYTVNDVPPEAFKL